MTAKILILTARGRRGSGKEILRMGGGSSGLHIKKGVSRDRHMSFRYHCRILAFHFLTSPAEAARWTERIIQPRMVRLLSPPLQTFLTDPGTLGTRYTHVACYDRAAGSTAEDWKL